MNSSLLQPGLPKTAVRNHVLPNLVRPNQRRFVSPESPPAALPSPIPTSPSTRPPDSSSSRRLRCNPSPWDGKSTKSPASHSTSDSSASPSSFPACFCFSSQGHVADRFDRRKVVTLCYCGFAVSSALLLTLAWQGSHSVHLIYAVVVLIGVVRAFNASGEPRASSSTGSGRALPQRGGVEREHLPGGRYPGPVGRRVSVRLRQRADRVSMPPLW